MKVRFWGTRGSLAKPGAATVRYGGNTSCVEVRTRSGLLIVIDCGTGGHDLGQALLKDPARTPGHMLISHTHWDHIQGIPFFSPFFVPGNSWTLYAAQGFGESLRDTLAGQMEYTYFPVTPDAFGAQVRYTHLGEGRFTIGDAVIHTRYLNHPALTLGFRIEADGATMVYACDHEPYQRAAADGRHALEGEDAAHAEFVTGADLLIHDAQYLLPEYERKIGWGHSTIDYAVAVARTAGVARLALTHHDPLRSDDAIDAIVAGLRADGTAGEVDVFAAAEGQEVELVGDRAASDPAADVSAIRVAAPGETHLVLLATDDPDVAERIERALADEPLVVEQVTSGAAALARLRQRLPALLLIDDRLPDMRADELAATLPADDVARLPIARLGGGDVPIVDPLVGALIEPWSIEYARTRIRTWLLRAECQWALPAIPADEALRLEALRALGLLDTPREDRFDRHTRLAAALFRVPMALISLVDANRQWFKSCLGVDLCEGPRETSFCAHAVADRGMLVVADTLLDPRFRDNPLVTGGPRIRFYAGALVHAPDGQPIGTLCILDTRPRDLDGAERRLLADLAQVVEEELHRPAQAA